MVDKKIPKKLLGIDFVLHTSLRGKNYIYTTVPKAGCQSSAQIIGKEHLGYVVVDDPNQQVRLRMPTTERRDLIRSPHSYDKYFKFTLVRHPRSRVRSFYFGAKGLPSMANIPLLKNVKSFEEYLTILRDVEDINTVDIHLLTQTAILYNTELLTGEDLPTTYDYIGKLEEWDKSWEHICKETGRDFDYSRKENVSKKRELTKREEELLDEVTLKHYSVDLENFDYEM